MLTSNLFLNTLRLISLRVDFLANHLLVLIAFFLPICDRTVGFMYIVLLILFLFKKDKKQALQNLKYNHVLWALFLYILLYYFGIFQSENMYSSFKYAQNADFLLYSFLIIIFLEYRFIPRIIFAYLIGIFVSEVFSYALAFGFIEGGFFSSNPFASVNNPSPFMYHIHYGFSLAFAAYLLLETIKRNPTFLLKALSALFFISISINLILNIGRTGYVLYIISLLLFIFLNYKQNSLKALPIALLSLTLAFLLAYQFSPLFKKRIDTTTQSVTKAFTKNDFKSSIGLRIEKYKLAYEAFKEKPLLGYGTGEHLQSIHQLAVEKKLWFASSIAGHPNLDSEYLDIIIQFGLLGLIVYLNIFYQSIKYKQPDPLLKNIQIVLVVLYILFSFEAVGVIHHKLAETFLFFISITLIKQTDKETPLPRTSNMELFIYILVGGIFFLRSQLHLGTHIKSFFIALF